jgi:ferredoxin
MPRTELPVVAHETGCGPVRPSSRAWKRALVLLLVHALIALHVVHWRLSGRTLTPLEPSEAGETLLTGAVNAGFVFFVLLILSTLVFGRFFCGWACHVVAYQDACAWLLAKLGLKPRPIRARLLALVPFLVALEMFVLPSVVRGQFFPELSWHLTTDSFWERFPGFWIATFTLLVTGGMVVWFFGAKGFCTYGCPYGALFAPADRLAPGRIRVTDACEGCGHCTAVCTSNVRVHQEVKEHGMVVDTGCMKCLDCVASCPKEALYFGFGKLPAPTQRARRTYDFGWTEELLMAVVFLAAAYAFRGLYGAVPLLLAVGLALLVAGLALLLARLMTRRELRFQHLVLRAGGRVTAGGAWLAFAALVALGGTAHSGIVQWSAREGEQALDAARAARDARTRDTSLSRAAETLARASKLGLVPSVELENKLGQVLFTLGRVAEAEPHLARAIELDDGNKSARVFLARALVVRGAIDEAAQLLERVFTLDPRDPGLPVALAELLRAAPEHAAALDLGARLAR